MKYTPQEIHDAYEKAKHMFVNIPGRMSRRQIHKFRRKRGITWMVLHGYRPPKKGKSKAEFLDWCKKRGVNPTKYQRKRFRNQRSI